MRPLPMVGPALLAALALSAAPVRPAAAAPVPVRVCEENRDWRRPTPDEMARTVWRDSRYADAATGTPLPHALAYYTHHFVFFTTPSPSGAEHVLDMTGLVTARPRGLCGARGEPMSGRRDLTAGRIVAVWVLGYHVLSADLTGDALTLTVEPNATTDRGYAIVEVARPPAAAWTARAVLADGREVARMADLRLWADEPGLVPPALFVPAAVPAGFGAPRAAIGDEHTPGLRLTYPAPDGTAGLLVLNAPAGCCLDADPRKQGLPVALAGGVTGHFLGGIQPEHGGPILWWVQDGTYVALSGPRLDRDDLVRIAASAVARPVRLPLTAGLPATALPALGLLGTAIVAAGRAVRRP